MKTTDLKRLDAFEKQYDTFLPHIQNLSNALDTFKTAYSDYVDLRTFYASEEWMNWHEKASSELKCGVLSQDILYNLITEHNDLLGEMLEMCSKMYKNI